MTFHGNPFHRASLPTALVLLAAACGPSQPPSASPVPTATQTQEAVTLRLCANRHDYNQITTVCLSAANTDPGALYQRIIDQMKTSVHCPGLAPSQTPSPSAWKSCLEYPPVMWPDAVSGAEGLAAWNEQARRIMAFYRVTTQQDVTMKSYELSLKKMREIASTMRQSNAPRLETLNKNNTTLKNDTLPGVIQQKAQQEDRTAQAELAGHRKELGEIEEITHAHKARIEAQQPAYSALVEQFAAYRANEPVVQARLVALAQQASAATLETLPNVQLELVQLSRAESLAPQQMLSDAARLIAQLAYEHEQFILELVPYRDFMKNHALRQPDLTDSSLRVLRSMAGYVDARYARTSDIISRTLGGIRRRREALVAQATEDAARATLVQASKLKASEDFVKEVNARVEEVNKLPPTSTDLELFYLAGKLQEHESILQLQPVCADVSSTPWLGTGCNLLALQFSKSSNYVATTIPSTIRMNVDLMRMMGVSEPLLLDVEQHLAANRLRAAALAHDVAVRTSDSLF